jgi:predicted RNA-binding Zn-ribbon protein involved in translation (DUF1610 family)
MSPDHNIHHHYCSVCGNNHEGTGCLGPKDMKIYYPPVVLQKLKCPHCGKEIEIEVKK